MTGVQTCALPISDCRFEGLEPVSGGFAKTEAPLAIIVARAGLAIEPWNGVVEKMRIIKSPSEIERIRRACRAAEAGSALNLEDADFTTAKDAVAAMSWAVMSPGIVQFCELFGL